MKKVMENLRRFGVLGTGVALAAVWLNLGSVDAAEFSAKKKRAPAASSVFATPEMRTLFVPGMVEERPASVDRTDSQAVVFFTAQPRKTKKRAILDFGERSFQLGFWAHHREFQSIPYFQTYPW